MEATNTRLKPNNMGKETRLFSSGLFEVVGKPEQILNLCVGNRQRAVKELRKGTHSLKCVNCNHRFFEVEAVAGTCYEEGGRILDAC